MNTTLRLMLGVCLGIIAAGCAHSKQKPMLPADELPAVQELPNPFMMGDGSTVKTARDWDHRRDELLTLIQHYEYGFLPPKGGKVKGTVLESRDNEALKAVERRVKLEAGPGGKVQYTLDLTIPQGKGPFPVVIVGDRCWGRVKDPVRAEMIRRGYALVEFDRTEIYKDTEKERAGTIFAAWPDYSSSALSAWAWGYHRAIDYLAKQRFVDAKRIVITGHSRGGKATLLAGATDTRIAVTAPNNSGCGGAGCYRFQAPKSEDIQAIVTRFPHWFAADFKQFFGRVDRIPFDQHSLKAAVAPRALLTNEALGDLWANPEGTQQTHLAAAEVYRFLGVPQKIGIHFRQGKHEQNEEDWKTLLDFADLQLFGKPTERKFDALAFPDSPRRFTWSAPK